MTYGPKLLIFPKKSLIASIGHTQSKVEATRYSPSAGLCSVHIPYTQNGKVQNKQCWQINLSIPSPISCPFKWLQLKFST